MKVVFYMKSGFPIEVNLTQESIDYLWNRFTNGWDARLEKQDGTYIVFQTSEITCYEVRRD